MRSFVLLNGALVLKNGQILGEVQIGQTLPLIWEPLTVIFLIVDLGFRAHEMD